jgi:hypothetical protein
MLQIQKEKTALVFMILMIGAITGVIREMYE